MVTLCGVVWAADRRLHTAENWVQFQEISVEYLVHVAGTDGGTLLVAQLVEAPRYKSEGRGFDSRWCHCKFSLT